MEKRIQMDDLFGLTKQIERAGMAIASCVAAAVEKAGTPEMFVLLKQSQLLTEELQQLLMMVKEHERSAQFDGIPKLQSDDVTIELIDLKKEEEK